MAIIRSGPRRDFPMQVTSYSSLLRSKDLTPNLISASKTSLVFQEISGQYSAWYGSFTLPNIPVNASYDFSLISGSVSKYEDYLEGSSFNAGNVRTIIEGSFTISQVSDAFETGDGGSTIFSGADTFYGTDFYNGDDKTPFGDVINGDIFLSGSGNDTIYGYGGNDFLAGERGNDKLYGDTGDDLLYGGVGDDYLDGGSGTNEMDGGSGNDTYIVDFGSASQVRDTIWDKSGAKDVIKININAGATNIISSYFLLFRTNNGKDLLIAILPNPDDKSLSNFLSSYVIGSTYNEDKLLTDASHYLLIKNQYLLNGSKFRPSVEEITSLELTSPRTFNLNSFTYSTSTNSISGTKANDLILSNGEFLYGLDGNDALFAKYVNNSSTLILDGGTGNDELDAALGNTKMIGGAGNDKFTGRSGNDTLIGGLGKDNLEGGNGNNLFVFENIKDSGATAAIADLIGDNDDNGGWGNDFTVGNDHIDLSAIDANLKTSGDQAFNFAGTTATKNSAWVSYDSSLYTGGSSLLWVDNSGDTKADMCVVIVGVDLRSEAAANRLVL